MRHREKIKNYKEKCRSMGKRSQEVQAENRLSNALNYRPINSTIIFEVWTHNPRNKAKHHLQIKHEVDNGNNKYNVYLDGVKWRKQFSRIGFCRWLFSKIDSVRSDWN